MYLIYSIYQYFNKVIYSLLLTKKKKLIYWNDNFCRWNGINNTYNKMKTRQKKKEKDIIIKEFTETMTSDKIKWRKRIHVANLD